jgi:hypothetical protein
VSSPVKMLLVCSVIPACTLCVQPCQTLTLSQCRMSMASILGSDAIMLSRCQICCKNIEQKSDVVRQCRWQIWFDNAPSMQQRCAANISHTSCPKRQRRSDLTCPVSGVPYKIVSFVCRVVVHRWYALPKHLNEDEGALEKMERHQRQQKQV